jgi:hypothetical protein
MTRRSRRDDAEIDALLAGAWQDGTAALAAVLDLKAGAAALVQTSIRSGPAGVPGAENPLLAEVRELLDARLAEVRELLDYRGGPAYSSITAYLITVREYLIQLRTGLTGRTMAMDTAQQMISGMGHALAEADRILRHLPPTPGSGPETREVTEILAGWQQQLPGLAGKVDRLFDQADDTISRIPVPTR